MSDYRCTRYCIPLQDIRQKKQEVLQSIRKDHPRAQNIYNIVRPRGTSLHREFCEVYSFKCAYCGCSLEIIPGELFEVDHLKPQAKAEGPEENINDIGNLVLACRKCNGSKKDYWCDSLKDHWHPDASGITMVFQRDDQFYIRIVPELRGNSDAEAFYKALRLGEQVRRLDYLLMLIDGYIKTCTDIGEDGKLREIYCVLLKKRNCMQL